jgi:16S rRNA (adenine1518-N6/adenine1519-N6)-dimethyltransferase
MENRFHKAKKSLGQNFLKSKPALRKMVSSAGITKGDTVLEIGPGKGALTRELLDTGAHIIAIEKDDRLAPFLAEMFASERASGQFTLLHGDALEFKPEDFIQGGYKLVANIPYYITGLLIRQYLESTKPPISMTILVQKEVAERIVVRDGKESILSLSVKVYGTPKYQGTVSKRYFSPAPKVDSAILHIGNITQSLSKQEQVSFFELIKQAFAHKRKTILHNLGTTYSKDRLKEILTTLGKSEQARAEELNISDWITVLRSLPNKKDK